jgi:pyruvate dehydrogenase E1 component alpha subunit
VKAELDWARSNGPVLMEARTYRFEGHGVSDKQFNAREDLREELETWAARDPINILRQHIISRFSGLEAELERLEAEGERVVEQSVEFAVNSPAPDAEDLVRNVYVGFSV